MRPISLLLTWAGISLLGLPGYSQFIPRVAVIDFYGLKTLSREKLLETLKLREGDPLPPSKGDLEERLEQLDDVVWAWAEAVCCADNGAILYIGIKERGSPNFDYNPPPQGDARLPETVLETYNAYLAAFRQALQKGSIEKDLSAGHLLLNDPACSRLQQEFIRYARENLSLLLKVLGESADPNHRAAAAFILGYAHRKDLAFKSLGIALRDPEEAVRENALSSIVPIILYSRKHPEMGIHAEPTWIIEMLHSIMWRDRFRAAKALVELTEDHDQDTLKMVSREALDSLFEMARWKVLEHALPAFILVGRIAGASEEEIFSEWKQGRRLKFLDELEQRLKADHHASSASLTSIFLSPSYRYQSADIP